MNILKIKHGGFINCRFCKAQGLRSKSTWHLTQLNIQSCDRHKPELQKLIANERPVSNDYSEADYQTWLRL